MHIGHTIIQADESETILFSPWLNRSADNAVFTYEEIQLGGSSTQLEVKVYTKNTEETGDGSARSETFASVGSSSVKTARFNGLEEMVRFRFRVHSGSIGETNFAIYRMLEPTWFDTE